MLYAAVAAVLGLSRQVDKFSLQFYQETFIARKGAVALRLPIRPPSTEPVTSVAFRRDQAFAVWDERGLSMRRGKDMFTTRMPGLTVSPKLFARDEILANLDRFKSKSRSKEADAVSGARRIGPTAYFLLRWDDRNGATWMEALVRVDLNAAHPRPALVGKFDGISLANKPIDDRLMILGGRLAILGRAGKNWNLDTYDPASGQFDSVKLGDSLVAFALDSPKSGVFVENTPYGTTRSGALDLVEGSRFGLTESPGFTRFLDGKHPLLFVERRPTGNVLANGETGALLPLTDDFGIGRMGSYVIVWGPREAPTRADLYDPERWEAVASWQHK